MRASSRAAWAFVFVAAAAPAVGQVPKLVSFQGRLTDGGSPVTGSVNLTFGIYDAATNGNLIWSESQMATVTGGLFTVVLGETTSLSAEILDGPRWVGVTPAGGSELSPRIRLTSAPYAVRASTALVLEGLATPVAQLNQLDGIGPTVTAANLSAVTNGASADALHTHPAVATAVSALQTQVSALQTDKVAKAGDTMSGVLVASAGIQYADGVTQTAAPSVVYTRWGRNTCPTGSQLTYAGYAASGNYQHSGSGRNMLCMTNTPTWGLFNDSDHQGALLYGVEFETISYGLAAPFPALQDLDGDCAVCLRTPASATLMVPGTQACPTGWTPEYAGYLMSTHYTQQGGQFVCVDANPEGRPGSALGSNGHLWYPTEAECGSLPCLPYVQNREVTCAVCSR